MKVISAKLFRLSYDRELPENFSTFGHHSEFGKTVGPYPVPQIHGRHSVVEEYKDDQDNSDNIHLKALHSPKPNPDTFGRYTKESARLNATLRSRQDSSEYPSDIKSAINGMSKEFSKLKSKKDCVVYTGVGWSPSAAFGDHNGSEHMHFPAYTSTSTSLEATKFFSGRTKHANDVDHGVEHRADGTGANHFLKINIPAGSKALSVRDQSPYYNEHEVLLDRGATVKIHPNPTHIGDNQYVWEADLIGHVARKIKE